nr:MAG: putative methyltransferase [Ustilaginoidea virens polymycovirus 1]WSP07093.1 putative methyltransferase [Ustilaginoidea virens polymycovirus 1]
MRRTGFSTPSSSARLPSSQSRVLPARVNSRRRPSDFSTTSLAAPSTSSVSTTRTGGANVRPPAILELHEYGDPVGEFVREHNYNPRSESDDGHLRYLTRAQLDQMRAVERLAGRALVSTAASLVPINGARVLLLASGRGATIAQIAKMGPCALTLVDASPDVIHGAVERVRAVGQSATVNLFPVVSDAWDFCRTTDETYDLIVCVHSIGQIVKARAGAVEEFISDVAAILAPGGLLVVDEHLGFTDPAGATPGQVEDRVERYVATGLGRFPDDVNYLLPRAVPDCIRRAEWVTPGAPPPMQRWSYMAYERRSRSEAPPPLAPVSYPRLAPLPVCGPVTDSVLFELAYPRASRGVKVPLARDDYRTVGPGRLMPKIDGTPAVLLLDGDVALFSGPKMGGLFYLPFSFPVRRVCTAELVLSSSGDYLLFVTGVIDRDDTPVDPNSNAELRMLDEYQDALSTVGILINTPCLISSVSGNTLTIPRSPAGRTVPVDGVNVLSGGRWGKFMKPSTTLSIDVTPADWPLLADELKSTTSVFRPFNSTSLPAFPSAVRAGSRAPSPSVDAEVNAVHELGVRMDGLNPVLVPMRPRPDKSGSDSLGKVVVFCSAVLRISAIAGEVRNVSQVVRYVTQV